MSCATWFTHWIHRYQKMVRHRDWIDPDSDLGLEYFEGWISAFDEHAVTQDEAERVTHLHQRKHPGYPEKHLEAILATVRDIRAKARVETAQQAHHAKPAPGLVEASVASMGCPECEGTGWAKRRFVWHSWSAPVLCDMFCRCAAGRWRYTNRDLAEFHGEENWEDLQALPELWDSTLSHATWSDRPTRRLIPPGPLWKYLRPSDPAPPVSTPARMTAARVFKPGLGKLPEFVPEARHTVFDPPEP